MSFCTSIHCMDGRIQEQVIRYLKEKHGVLYVDAITEPGANRFLALREDPAQLDAMRRKIEISLDVHRSQLIAISGHHDCAGNPVSRADQLQQLDAAAEWLQETYPQAQVEKLWIDSLFNVEAL